MQPSTQLNAAQRAVRDLRKALGESQQAFAYRMKTAVRTIARWETVQSPPVLALGQLVTIAKEAGQKEIAQVFAEALARELGYDSPGTVVKISDLHISVTIKAEEKPHFEALLLMLRNPDQCSQELAQWEKIRNRIAKKAEGKK